MRRLGAARAVAARALASAAETPTAAAALFAFYLLCGYLFLTPLFFVGQASIRPLLDFAPLLLTLLVPALTMGLLAEELRTGTFETLATAPLESWDAALGKYLGFAALHAALIGGLLFYPLCLSLLAAPPGLDWGESLGVLLGLLLQGLLFGAAGLFASSLTRSQAAAYVLAFALCFALLACGRLGTFLPPMAARALEWLSVEGRLETLARGVLDVRDLAYFATGCAGFFYLAVQRLEARRS